jgi:hypothetical protein
MKTKVCVVTVVVLTVWGMKRYYANARADDLWWILTPTARIAIAMRLAAHPVAVSTFTPAQVHRVEGIVVYFAGLMLLYELVQRCDRAAAARCGQ